MEIRSIKHMVKLNEWQELVRTCRNSGLPVRKWCAANGICPKTYYRWEHEVIKTAMTGAEQACVQPSPALVKVEPSSLAETVETRRSIPAQVQGSVIVRDGSVSIEFPAGTAPEQLALFVRELRHA